MKLKKEVNMKEKILSGVIEIKLLSINIDILRLVNKLELKVNKYFNIEVVKIIKCYLNKFGVVK